MGTLSRVTETRGMSHRGVSAVGFANRAVAGAGGVVCADAGRGREVLIVDDEPGIRSALLAHFSREGWRVTVAGGVREAEMRIAQTDYSLVVTDVRLADGTGVELLRQLRSAASRAPVILLTGFGTVAEAVEAMQLGASDYLMKPVAWKDLSARVACMELKQLKERDDEDARGGSRQECGAGVWGDTAGAVSSGIIGRSSALLQVMARARAAGTIDAHVLVEGESGTGKKLLARYVHASSARASRLLVVVDCAAPLECFGEIDGAVVTVCAVDVDGAPAANEGSRAAHVARPGEGIAGAIAEAFRRCALHSGTLLLEHVDALSADMQRALAACLEEAGEGAAGTVRVLGTAGSGIGVMVEQGRFRSDLYYRLSGIALDMPALRERESDVALLAQHFAKLLAERAGIAVPVLERGFIERLAEQEWPGNVGQLRRCMGALIVGLASSSSGARLEAECLDLWQADVQHGCGSKPGASRRDGLQIKASRADTEFALQGGWSQMTSLSEVRDGAWAGARDGELVSDQAGFPGANGNALVGMPIRQLERLHVEKTLAMTNGNRTKAAELLGISVRTMRNKIREYGLPPRRYA
jgi:DNA-binding NtrC family response regulator